MDDTTKPTTPTNDPTPTRGLDGFSRPVAIRPSTAIPVNFSTAESTPTPAAKPEATTAPVVDTPPTSTLDTAEPVVTNEPVVPTPAAVAPAPAAEQPRQPDILSEIAEAKKTEAAAADQPLSTDPAPASALKPESLADQQPTITPSKQPSRKGKSAVILVAVLFALALIGGAGYAYWQNRKTVTPAATPAVTEKAKDPATSEDVDKTSTDIDDQLKKVDDSKDYQESDTTDAALGL